MRNYMYIRASIRGLLAALINSLVPCRLHRLGPLTLLVHFCRVYNSLFGRLPEVWIKGAHAGLSSARIGVCKFAFIVIFCHGTSGLSVAQDYNGPQVPTKHFKRLGEFCAGPGALGLVTIKGVTLKCQDFEIYSMLIGMGRPVDASLLRAEVNGKDVGHDE